MVVILVAVTFILLIAFGAIFSKARERKISASTSTLTLEAEAAVFEKRSLSIPESYMLSKNHIWLKKIVGQEFRVGVDDFIVKSLGNIKVVFSQPVGAFVAKGEVLFTAKVWRNNISFYAPVDCKIIQQNDSLNNRSLEDAYGLDWVVRIESVSSFSNMILETKHAIDWLSSEFNRLKDFVAYQYTAPGLEPATMFDGGQMMVGVVPQISELAVSEFENDFLRS